MGWHFLALMSVSPADAFGPKTMALLTAQILSWRQGAGTVGGLHLHECWNTDSVLSRGYHGPTSSQTGSLLGTAVMLGRRRGDVFCLNFADALAAELVFQQAPGGGFRHASSEFEPTYTPEESCPIHQTGPLRALISYFESLPGGAPARAMVEAAIHRQVAWFCRHWWKRGNEWTGPLDFPGWCGVTNQDLEAIAALARYGAVFGNWEPFEKQGCPALETFLGPRYRHDTGLFERGDRPNFTERCGYMVIIFDMLQEIHALRPDERIPEILERLGELLAAAVGRDARGRLRLAWGADDQEIARSGALAWDRARGALSPGFVRVLATRPEIAAEVGTALAEHVFADGTLAALPDPKTPLMAIAPAASHLCQFWKFLAARHDVDFANLPPVPVVRRTFGRLSYFSAPEVWVIRDGDSVVFRGVKAVSHGVLASGRDLPNHHFVEPPVEIEETIGSC